MNLVYIFSNDNVKFNPENVDILKDLMKLGLSNPAKFIKDNNVADKVKAIEDKISNMLMEIQYIQYIQKYH